MNIKQRKRAPFCGNTKGSSKIGGVVEVNLFELTVKMILARFERVKILNARQKRLLKLLVCGVILISGASTIAAQNKASNNVKKQATLVYEAETRLAELGYWIVKADGIKDASTKHAVAAFQKVEGRKRTGVLNEKEFAAMRASSRPAAKFPGAAHIEVDIARQVLFLVDDAGRVARILPVSTGTDEKYFSEGKWEIAHTPHGEFKITRQIFGIRRAPLGNLYYPNYFFSGAAIHGSASIPVFPASHGCVRIPNFAAKEFQTLISIGMPVIIYD